MARVILGNNETYTVFNNSQASDVFGSNGAADIVVIGGNTKAPINVQSSVERVELTGKVGDYTFQGAGNQISVLSGGVVQATVFANADTGGTKVAFADGSALLTISSAGLKLGNATVASTAGAITAAAAGLNASDLSTAPGLGGSVTPPATAQTFTLTTSADNFVGTAGDNAIVARTVNGANTLQDGDVVDGGAGYDTVYADFVSTGNATTPYLKNIESVVVRAQAVTSSGSDLNGVGTSSTDGNNMPQNRAVQIDAQRSLAVNEANKVIADIGVNNWESSNSRADVVIEDVRIGNTQKTKDITITFRESDPGNVDFGVYFDEHSLRNTGSGSTAINILLMDTAAANSSIPAIAATPLLDVNFNSYTFFQDNVKVFLGGAGTAAGAAINDALTYADMKKAFELALKTANVGGVVKDLSTSVTVSLSAPVNMTNEANKSAVSSSVAASFLNLTGQVITLTSAGTSTITSRSSTGESGGWESLGLAPSTGAIVQTFNTGNTSTTELVTSTIVLDDVGRVSTGGDLVVGGLSTGDTSQSRGVERFEITVQDSSKLQTINSTNNALREVTIVNGPTSNSTSAYNIVSPNAGDLTVNGNAGLADDNLPGVNNNTTWGAAGVGQNPAQASVPHSGTGAAGFTDVRLIDGSAMTGKLNFTANISVDSIGKYVNSVDTAGSPTDDVAGAGNVNFNTRGANFLYTGGSNGDTMVVNIDGAVAASRSLNVSGLSDFTFTIDGGAGNDNVTLKVVDGPFGGTQAWYVNQKQNANITITTGDGADTIRTPGAGDVKILAGAGNDTVYTDNTGTSGLSAGGPAAPTVAAPRAVWVLNTANQLAVGAGYTLGTNEERNLADLKSGDNNSINLARGKVTVTFLDLTATADIASTNYVTSDLQINQAIKAAINNNAVLSKLLVASDGPASSLVITSLIDGLSSNADFAVAISAPAGSTFTAAELAEAIAVYTGNDSGTTLTALSPEADVLAYMQTKATPKTSTGGDYVDQLAESGTGGSTPNVELAGADSLSSSDNTITPGEGNDVIVLGTTTGGSALNTFTSTLVADTALAASNERIVFAGSFGNDTIVNFGARTVTDLGVQEVFTATFGASTTSGSVVFDGVTYAAGAAADTVNAAGFVAAYNAVAATTYTAAVASGSAVVTFTAKNVGALADATTSSFTSAVLGVTPVTVTVQGAAPVNDADTLNFSALGGSSNASFNNAVATAGVVVTAGATASKTIVIDDLVKPVGSASAVAGVNNTTADLVANLFVDSGSATAKTFVYVAVDTATNIGSVYSVTDAVGGTVAATTTAGGSNVTATLVGTIDLADTLWSTLTAANFS